MTWPDGQQHNGAQDDPHGSLLELLPKIEEREEINIANRSKKKKKKDQQCKLSVYYTVIILKERCLSLRGLIVGVTQVKVEDKSWLQTENACRFKDILMCSPFLLRRSFEGELMKVAVRLDRSLEMCKLA